MIVGVCVGVTVGVWVGVTVGVLVGVAVGVLVGVLVEARKRGLLPEAASIAEALHRKAGFWLSGDLRRLVVG